VGTPSYSVPVQRQPVPKVFPMRSHAIILMHDLAGILTAFPRCFRAQRVPVIPFFLKLPRCSRGVTVAEVFSMCSRSTSARSQGVPNVGTPSYSVPVQRQPVPKVFPMRSHAIILMHDLAVLPYTQSCPALGQHGDNNLGVINVGVRTPNVHVFVLHCAQCSLGGHGGGGSGRRGVHFSRFDIGYAGQTPGMPNVAPRCLHWPVVVSTCTDVDLPPQGICW